MEFSPSDVSDVTNFIIFGATSDEKILNMMAFTKLTTFYIANDHDSANLHFEAC